MYLIQITVETRIIIGIAAMVVLLVGFIVAFVFIQQKKMEYQKNMQAVLEQKQQLLSEQNEMLEAKVQERTAELHTQKEALQTSLTELKATQQQLVQSEKMASLGEMTAGIAHEIQNPLNFVNNFSEVSVELLDEMEEELSKGDINTGLKVASELKENLRKIHNHGIRADKIVKGMLEHSRTRSGKKEIADLNALLRESLQLSFNGLKSKIPDAHITINFEENPKLPPILLLSQEISRVFINIFNNAMYAIMQKQKIKAQEDYQPEISVAAIQSDRNIKIVISDNGMGIPEAVLQKIYQPFFTTKPTGEGTGLGLSLSYDIITQAHGGKLEAHSTEGAGTTFTITLPLS
jgi:two-component system, NtrC family, sensor kinase